MQHSFRLPRGLNSFNMRWTTLQSIIFSVICHIAVRHHSKQLTALATSMALRFLIKIFPIYNIQIFIYFKQTIHYICLSLDSENSESETIKSTLLKWTMVEHDITKIFSSSRQSKKQKIKTMSRYFLIWSRERIKSRGWWQWKHTKKRNFKWMRAQKMRKKKKQKQIRKICLCSIIISSSIVW